MAARKIQEIINPLKTIKSHIHTFFLNQLEKLEAAKAA